MSQKYKVLIGPSRFAEADQTPMMKLRESGLNIIDNPYGRKLTKPELAQLLPGVQGILAGLETLDEEIMANSELKVISRVGSGISNVDLAAAKRLGIAVKSTPLAPITAVAELTIGCLLTLLRKVSAMDQALHSGRWLKLTGTQLHGKKVAVIGYGNIGQRVGTLLQAFGAEVLAVDPQYTKAIYGVPVNTLEEALSVADIVTIHSGGQDQLLGQREFDLMKPGTYLLNAARGHLVDEEALRQALDDKRVAGAWLDTFANEPYTGELTNYPQVMLTPHVGSYTVECRLAMEMEAVENLLDVLRG
jgi:D-3-phosphoglycerate dehydrogenase